MIEFKFLIDRLIGFDSKERVSTPTGEFPITSMLDHSVSQRTPSGSIQQQQPSNVDDKSAQSLSFRSYGYQTPSKTTINVSSESSQSLTSVQSKSMHTPQSNISTLSPKTLSKNNIQEKKSTPSVIKNDSKRSSKKSINQTPSLHQSPVKKILFECIRKYSFYF
jgi:hypothetical protein